MARTFPLLFATMVPLCGAAEEMHAFAASAALYSEYEYRGLSQSSGDPVVQLAVDYAHRAGFYAGTVLTPGISWLQDTALAYGSNAKARVELNVYGGYKWRAPGGVVLDAGYRRYAYPGASAIRYPESSFGVGTILERPDTDELYAGVSWGPVAVQYSYAIDELFGVKGSEGSDYLELSLSRRFAGTLQLRGSVGNQRYKGDQVVNVVAFHNPAFDYTVWKLGANYAFSNGVSIGGYYSGTDADPAYFTVRGENWAKDRVVAFVAWAF